MVGVARGWKVAVVVLAVAGVVSTPVVWLLDGPGAGQVAGASVQAAVAIAALVWAMFQPGGDRAEATVTGSGPAEATDGARSVTGLLRRAGRGPARVENSGPATARDAGSSAVSGIEDV
ncbi:hypothetical protein LUW75_03425 [Streptomyces sp. MRC013]|nr:hypothetical protein [Streptomyces sp. MRC013]URM89215.1 hypothetical protein LUW75_03425 [Streptomyces sp. MRC013]